MADRSVGSNCVARILIHRSKSVHQTSEQLLCTRTCTRTCTVQHALTYISLLHTLTSRRQSATSPHVLEQLPCIASTHPFTPAVKMRRLWARLSTHVPTEPAVTGGEHTSVGFSAAGLLLWLSPWQVRGSTDVAITHTSCLTVTAALQSIFAMSGTLLNISCLLIVFTNPLGCVLATSGF